MFIKNTRLILVLLFTIFLSYYYQLHALKSLYLIYSVFFKGTKVLLNLTHLPLTKINDQYLISFIGLGSFVTEKISRTFQQIKPQNYLFP